MNSQQPHNRLRILGVDPGSRLTGYGIVDNLGSQLSLVTHGTIKLASTSGPATIALEDRLHQLHIQLTSLIHEYQPQVMVVERVFFAKNALSSLKLGQTRGAILLTAVLANLKVAELSPTEVKLAITGHGRADKHQLAKMLEIIIGKGKQNFETADASDALGLAICYARNLKLSILQDSSGASAYFETRKKKPKAMSLADSIAHQIGATRKP